MDYWRVRVVARVESASRKVWRPLELHQPCRARDAAKRYRCCSPERSTSGIHQRCNAHAQIRPQSHELLTLRRRAPGTRAGAKPMSAVAGARRRRGENARAIAVAATSRRGLSARLQAATARAGPHIDAAAATTRCGDDATTWRDATTRRPYATTRRRRDERDDAATRRTRRRGDGATR